MLFLVSWFIVLRPKAVSVSKVYILLFELGWIATLVVAIMYFGEQLTLWDELTTKYFVTGNKYYTKAEIEKNNKLTIPAMRKDFENIRDGISAQRN